MPRFQALAVVMADPTSPSQPNAGIVAGIEVMALQS
jgi:hypothetical protein